MSIQVGDILRIVAVLQWLDGDIMQNVYNAVISGSGGPYDEDDIVADALDWVETMYANLVARDSDDMDGSEVRVYEYDAGDDDWDEIGSDAWVYNPTGTSEQLPRGVARLVNFKTSDADVSGKKYLGGGVEDAAASGLWSAGEITALGNYAGDVVTPFAGATSGADWVPGVWSPTGTVFVVYTGAVIIPTIPAYQRRRKQGVGI